MGAKYTQGAPNGTDLVNSLSAIEKDTGCKARIIISLTPEQHLTIRCEAFTEQNEVRIGVARGTERWREGDGTLLGKVFIALHRIYHQAYARSHTPPQ
jgi:hypothetical protein